MSKTNFVGSFMCGLARKTGFTASSRITETLGKKLINPKSKLRKKIDKFELTGDFKTSIKKIYTLIETFYEEYFTVDLPLTQIGMYYQSDIRFVESKIGFLENYIISDDDASKHNNLCLFWNNIKNQIQNR
jgi:hypothetical protein